MGLLSLSIPEQIQRSRTPERKVDKGDVTSDVIQTTKNNDKNNNPNDYKNKGLDEILRETNNEKEEEKVCPQLITSSNSNITLNSKRNSSSEEIEITPKSSTSNSMNLLFLLLALFQGYIFFNVTRKSFTLANTDLIETLNFKKSDIGIISSSFTAVYGISKLLGSIMTDIVDSTYLFCGSLFLSGIVCLFFPFFTSISMFSVLWSINGLIQGAGWPSLAKLCADRVPSDKLGKAISIMTAAGNLGSVLAPALVMIPQAYFFGKASTLADGECAMEEEENEKTGLMIWQGIMLISGIYGIVGAIIAFLILTMTEDRDTVKRSEHRSHYSSTDTYSQESSGYANRTVSAATNKEASFFKRLKINIISPLQKIRKGKNQNEKSSRYDQSGFISTTTTTTTTTTTNNNNNNNNIKTKFDEEVKEESGLQYREKVNQENRKESEQTGQYEPFDGQEKEKQTQKQNEAKKASGQSKDGLWNHLKTIIWNPAYISCILADSFGYFILKGIAEWSVLYLKDSYNLSQPDALSVVFFSEVGAIAGNILAGALSDRLGGLRSNTAALLAFLSGIFLTIAWQLPRLFELRFLFFLIGIFANGPKTVAAIGIRQVVHPAVTGLALGIAMMIGQMGASSAGAPLGYMIETHGWSTVLMAWSISSFLATFLWLIPEIARRVNFEREDQLQQETKKKL